MQLHSELGELGSLDRRLDALEAALALRLPRLRGLHPAIAQALEELAGARNVNDVVKQSGYSHRTFISLFRQSVGLTPKLYSRLMRFQRALRQASAKQPASWANLSADVGYSDQAHFNREFREFVGGTPTQYREVSPRFPHHLPLGPARPR